MKILVLYQSPWWNAASYYTFCLVKTLTSLGYEVIFIGASNTPIGNRIKNGGHRIFDINLFEKITGVSTRYCFEYNNAIIFSVPKNLIPRSLGPDARNIYRMSDILRKRIKVIPIPRDVGDTRAFIGAIVSPVTFKGLDIICKSLTSLLHSDNI